MKIIIQKFGGTSVITKENREKVVSKIETAINNGFSPIIVVSAMGRKGDPYATDTLVQLIQDIFSETNPHEMDLLLSCGEIISAVVLASTLKSKGFTGHVLTGGQAGIITNQNYGNSTILKVDPYNIEKVLANGEIPIVAGFQGVSEDGNITTLGRGGSDTTAAILGEALKALQIEIYTDVDGIMTADPRVVPNATVLNTIHYSEVFQIADQGAKVIHPKAVEIAMRCNIPLIIKNTMNESPGTIISSYPSDNTIEMKDKRVITSIANILNRSQITVTNLDADAEKNILFALANDNISIDLINIFPDKMIFTIDSCYLNKAEECLKACNNTYRIISNCAKISIIGNRMRGIPGIMSRIIRTLVLHHIEVLQTSDSHTTISCLINDKDTTRAIVCLHEEFELWRT